MIAVFSMFFSAPKEFVWFVQGFCLTFFCDVFVFFWCFLKTFFFVSPSTAQVSGFAVDGLKTPSWLLQSPGPRPPERVVSPRDLDGYVFSWVFSMCCFSVFWIAKNVFQTLFSGIFAWVSSECEFHLCPWFCCTKAASVTGKAAFSSWTPRLELKKQIQKRMMKFQTQECSWKEHSLANTSKLKTPQELQTFFHPDFCKNKQTQCHKFLSVANFLYLDCLKFRRHAEVMA